MPTDRAGDAITRRGLPLDPELRVLAIGSFATRFGRGAVTRGVRSGRRQREG